MIEIGRGIRGINGIPRSGASWSRLLVVGWPETLLFLRNPFTYSVLFRTLRGFRGLLFRLHERILC